MLSIWIVPCSYSISGWAEWACFSPPGIWVQLTIFQPGPCRGGGRLFPPYYCLHTQIWKANYNSAAFIKCNLNCVTITCPRACYLSFISRLTSWSSSQLSTCAENCHICIQYVLNSFFYVTITTVNCNQ